MFLQEAYAAGTIHLPNASTIASSVDAVSDFIFWMSVFFTITIPAAMLYFIVKYHRSQKGRTTSQIEHNTAMEVVWTFIPLILMLFIFGWGWVVYEKMLTPGKDAYEINVLGRQWSWTFQYANGRQSLNEMYIPAGRPIKLIMTSEDVIHSFFIPNFRVKQDVVPGMYTPLTFEATQLGSHKIFCTEFCGTGHSDMLAKVKVVDAAVFEEWLKTGKSPEINDVPLDMIGFSDVQGNQVSATAKSSGKKVEDTGAVGPSSTSQLKPLADQGKDLYTAKGCVACHSVDGGSKVGPTFKGVFGTEVTFQDGTKAKVDENYLRESIEDSNKKVVKGYAASMPLYRGTLSDTEINALVAYIKSLK